MVCSWNILEHHSKHCYFENRLFYFLSGDGGLQLSKVCDIFPRSAKITIRDIKQGTCAKNNAVNYITFETTSTMSHLSQQLVLVSSAQ